MQSMATTQQVARTSCTRTGHNEWPQRSRLQPQRCLYKPQQQPQLKQHAIVAHAQQHSSAGSALAVASIEEEQLELSMAPGQEPAIEWLGVIEGMQTVRGRLNLDVDADLVYQLLTDYTASSRVFANIASSEVLLGEDGSTQLMQACKWQFLALAGTFNLHLTVQEEPASRLLVFRLIESSFMRDFEGRWQVTPAGPASCSVEHVLAVKPLMPIPAAISQYTKNIFTRQVSAILADLRAEVERQASQGSSSL